MSKKNILGYCVFSGTVDSCTDQMMSTIIAPDYTCRVMACLNPHSYVTAKSDANFQLALYNADWLMPDGVGVFLASKIIGDPLFSQITGPDLFYGLMARLDAVGGSVFFLGSSDAILDKIKSNLSVSYPNIMLVGTYSPPFKSEFSEEDNIAMVTAVNAVRPDVLWVGMTAPKQEKWLQANRKYLDVKVAGSVGAVFDFFSGNTKRAPEIMRRLGLEWFHRSLMSPTRLGRRNAISNPKFVFEVLRYKLIAGINRHFSGD